MLKVGLTGGIGCGKSTAINTFRDLGVDIIDADKIAREIVSIGSPVLDEIAQLFGNDILLETGELNRQQLKKIVFAPSKAGEDALADLESITHPKIRAEIKSRIHHTSSHSDKPYLIVDIPLLLEKGYQSLFERIVVVDCLVEQQVERVKQRDELDESTILKIIKQQATREARKNIATDMLDNSKDINHLIIQVKQLHDTFVGLSQS